MFDETEKRVLRLHIDNITKLWLAVMRHELVHKGEDLMQRFLAEIHDRNTPSVVLHDYLDSLNVDTLHRLSAIMLLGRDYSQELRSVASERNMSTEDLIISDPSYSVNSYFDFLLGQPIDRDGVVPYIASKAPLGDYLREGCNLLGI